MSKRTTIMLLLFMAGYFLIVVTAIMLTPTCTGMLSGPTVAGVKVFGC